LAWGANPVEKLMTVVQTARHLLIAGALIFPQTLSRLAFYALSLSSSPGYA
jgi:hypothetical protein